MDPEPLISSVRLNISHIRPQMHLRTRDSIILSKSGCLEFLRNNDSRNESQFFKIQPRYLLNFHASQTLFQLPIPLIIFILVFGILFFFFFFPIRTYMASLIVLDTDVISLFIFLILGNFSILSFLGTTSEPSTHIDYSFGSLSLLVLLSQKGFQLVSPIGQVQNHSLKFSILCLEIFDRLFEIHLSY